MKNISISIVRLLLTLCLVTFLQAATVTYPSAGPDTYTVPQGVYRIDARAIGGGGAGAGINAPSARRAYGTGGGAGAYASSIINVVPGEVFNLTVASGGRG